MHKWIEIPTYKSIVEILQIISKIDGWVKTKLSSITIQFWFGPRAIEFWQQNINNLEQLNLQFTCYHMIRPLIFAIKSIIKDIIAWKISSNMNDVIWDIISLHSVKKLLRSTDMMSKLSYFIGIFSSSLYSSWPEFLFFLIPQKK